MLLLDKRINDRIASEWDHAWGHIWYSHPMEPDEYDFEKLVTDPRTYLMLEFL